MRVIIAGSREINNKDLVFQKIDMGLQELYYWRIINDNSNLTLISGGALGVDTFAKEFSFFHKINFIEYLAEWTKYGKKAGYLRNIEMAESADALIAIWDGKSKGTKHMIDIAKKKGLKIFVYEITECS